MSKLERIVTFIQVIEEQSFAAAAKKQGLSTAAISKQISNLEADLKVQLLLRTTRKLKLTEIGEQYYQQCKKALHQLTDAESLIAGSHKEATGILKVTSSRYFAIRYIIPHLKEFLQQNPKLKIKLELAERFPNLAQEEIDILFGVSLEGPADLVRRRVASTRYVICASPAYFKKYGTPKKPQDLIKHRYITHSIRKPDNILTFKNNKEVMIDPILWLNDSRAMRGCAIDGLGIVKLHDYVVAEELKNKKLIEVLREFQEPQETVYLYYQQNRYLQPKIRRFIDFYMQKIV